MLKNTLTYKYYATILTILASSPSIANEGGYYPGPTFEVSDFDISSDFAISDDNLDTSAITGGITFGYQWLSNPIIRGSLNFNKTLIHQFKLYSC